MAIRLSTGLVNKLLTVGSFKSIFSNFVIDIYSGTQPTTADAVPTGTKLVTLTLNGGAHTAETAATGSITLVGSAGSIDTLTVNGLDILGGSVAYITDLSTTAAAVCAAINSNPKNKLFVASNISAAITLTAVEGLGTAPNGWVVDYTATTMTATPVNFSGGVDAVNGLRFSGEATAGVMSKLSSQTWSGTVLNTGVAGWFRMREANDAGTAESTTAARYDGSIAGSGAQMNMPIQTLIQNLNFSVQSGSITLPTT